jgi:hypothetical protein
MEKNKPKNKLYFTIGIPRSGKSSIASSWANYFIDIYHNTVQGRNESKKFHECSRVVVCADTIRLALTGQRFVKEAEGTVHAIKDVMIRTLLRQGYDVLVDGTHTLKSHIKELLYIDPQADFLLIDTPVAFCKDRADKSGQSDLYLVIDRMNKNLMIWKDNPKDFIDEIRKEVA